MSNKPSIKSVGISNDVVFGIDVSIIEPVNLYGCEIGERTFIGPFVEVQKNVKIGSDCKIQSHSFICEFVNIGDNVFVSHGVVFINDLFKDGAPAGGDKSKWESTQIGNNVSIGSNATVLPVYICDNTVIGAGSVVTKNIEEPGIYAGNPCKLIKKL